MIARLTSELLGSLYLTSEWLRVGGSIVLLLGAGVGVSRVLLMVGVEAGTNVLLRLPYMLSRSLPLLAEAEAGGSL
jgi:hypothetical protein